jgi:DnaJ-domain-containing protein 1
MTKCNICGSNRLDDYECGTCHQAKKDADKLAQYIAREDANFARQAERFEAFVKMQTEAILAAVEGKKPAAPAGLKPGTVGDISRLLAAALDTVRSEMYKLKEGGRETLSSYHWDRAREKAREVEGLEAAVEDFKAWRKNHGA